jgi:hypothetical protein
MDEETKVHWDKQRDIWSLMRKKNIGDEQDALSSGTGAR